MAFVSTVGVSPTAGLAGAAVLYLGVGAGVAVALRRRRVEVATVWSALVVWPLLLPLLSPLPPPPVAGRGPLADRIGATFRAIEAALAHPAAADVDWRVELEGLGTVLYAADERLALVDRLLLDTADDPELRADVETLRAARAHAAAEIEAVLSGMAQLRLRIGLLALAGESAGIGEHLRRWKDRVAALDEVSGL